MFPRVEAPQLVPESRGHGSSRGPASFSKRGVVSEQSCVGILETNSWCFNVTLFELKGFSANGRTLEKEGNRKCNVTTYGTGHWRVFDFSWAELNPRFWHINPVSSPGAPTSHVSRSDQERKTGDEADINLLMCLFLRGLVFNFSHVLWRRGSQGISTREMTGGLTTPAANWIWFPTMCEEKKKQWQSTRVKASCTWNKSPCVFVSCPLP